MILKVENLTAGYPSGGLVLEGLSLELAAGEVIALLGRNGMGKTTLLRCLTGQLRLRDGTIDFDGGRLNGLSSFEIANAGIGYVPQGREIFKDFTADENLLMGLLGKPSLPNRLPDDVYELFPILKERRAQRAGTMSGGQQQQLAIMRALVGQPRLLLLDEPVAGMNHEETAEMAATLSRVNADLGITMLLVEHDMSMVMGISDRVCVLDFGRRIALDTPANVVRDEAVIDAYLGGAL